MSVALWLDMYRTTTHLYTENMMTHFSQFGTVTECVVMKDPFQPESMKRNRCDSLSLSLLFNAANTGGSVLSNSKIPLQWIVS